MNVSYSPAFWDSKTKPAEKNWLTDNIMLRLDEYKPTVHLTSDQDVNHQDYERAFKAASADPDFLHWQNQYQLHQAVNYMADMYGFSTNYSGNKIFCACGESHLQKKKQSRKQPDIGFNAPSDSSRKRCPISSLVCNMSIFCSNVIRPRKGAGIAKEGRMVKLSTMQLYHNHKLNKQMLVKAKVSTHRYSISLDGCRKLLEMMDLGPLPTKTLKHYLEKQYPNSFRIASMTVFNVRVKVKKLRSQYGSEIQSIPNSILRRTFNPDSLEKAPENWDADPKFAIVFKDAMREVLSGDGTESMFPIIKIMERIKHAQKVGYAYRVMNKNNYRPEAVMHMVPAMVRGFC